MDNLTPPTPPEARRITPDCQPTYPCWLWNNVYNEWHHATLGMWTNCDPRKSYTFTHWHPDQPTAPTQPPAPLDASQDLPEGPGCTRDPNTCGVKYCGWPNRCETDEPAPLAGGTAHDPSTAPAEVAAGCKEGRPVSPATGEREAELRAVLHGVVTMFCASASSYLNGYSRDEAVDELLSALTPLLDRREAARQRFKDAVVVALRKDKDELSAKDAEIARLKEELDAQLEKLTQLNDALAETERLKKQNRAMAAGRLSDPLLEATVGPLQTQLTAAQSALRESEAARGEDSKRLDFMERQRELDGNRRMAWSVNGGIFVAAQGCDESLSYPTIRAAIDAARAKASASDSEHD